MVNSAGLVFLETIRLSADLLVALLLLTLVLSGFRPWTRDASLAAFVDAWALQISAEALAASNQVGCGRAGSALTRTFWGSRSRRLPRNGRGPRRIGRD